MEFKEVFEQVERECRCEFTHSGGPGGQNVNKRDTKAVIGFDVMKSTVLTVEQKLTLFKHSRVNKDGVLKIANSETRKQADNRRRAFEVLRTIIKEKLFSEPLVRVPTRKGFGVKAKERQQNTAQRRKKAARQPNHTDCLD